MKDKVMMFIIGFLSGAVLATGIFYIYNKNSNTTPNGQPPEMTNGQEPPEKPSGENGQPPEMQNNNNQENSNE